MEAVAHGEDAWALGAEAEVVGDGEVGVGAEMFASERCWGESVLVIELEEVHGAEGGDEDGGGPVAEVELGGEVIEGKGSGCEEIKNFEVGGGDDEQFGGEGASEEFEDGGGICLGMVECGEVHGFGSFGGWMGFGLGCYCARDVGWWPVGGRFWDQSSFYGLGVDI